MLIFLYGPDAYRVRAATHQIVQKYKDKHQSGVNFFNFDLREDGGLDKLKDAVKSISFFGEVKLIIANGVFSSKDIAREVEEICQNYSVDTIGEVVLLVMEVMSEKEISAKNKKLFETLKGKGKPVQYFDFLSGAQLTGWINKEAAQLGAEIDSRASALLIERAGGDSWALHNEIYKLAAYSKKINENNVVAMVSGKIDPNIFDFTDALAGQDRKRAFTLLAEELEAGKDPHYLLSMVIFQFRNLLILKDLTLRSAVSAASKYGMHPFVARKLSASIKKFDSEYLKERFLHLQAIDMGSKEGILNLEDELYNFVLT